jgi:hypothetical protein
MLLVPHASSLIIVSLKPSAELILLRVISYLRLQGLVLQAPAATAIFLAPTLSLPPIN